MSESIERLKKVKEKIPDNYTSSQIISILDNHIYKIIKYLIYNTSYIDRFIVNFLQWNKFKGKRQLSGVTNEELIIGLLKYLMSNKKKKYKIFRSLMIERNILFNLIYRYTTLANEYRELSILNIKENQGKRLYEIATMLETPDVWTTSNYCNFWYNTATGYKNAIIEKYMRLAVNTAVSYKRSNPAFYINLDDLVHDLVQGINRGIDKYCQTKGTLTSYIGWWFKDVLNSTSKSSANHYKKQQLTNESYTIEKDNDDAIHKVRLLAKYADPLGYGRLALGVEEVLNNSEIAILKKCKVKL